MLGFAGLLREWEQGLFSDFVRGELANEAKPDEALTFQFNPTQIQYRRAASFTCATVAGKGATGSGNSQKLQSPTTLSFTLTLDDTTRPLSLLGSSDTSVLGDHLTMLWSWTDVADPPEANDKTAPPTLVFQWGKLTIGAKPAFRCKLRNLTVAITMFNPDGSPMRATANVRLEGVEAAERRQNPTSGVDRVTRRHALRSGQTLQGVAFEAFGSPGAWRRIAELNGIDDPTRLRVGTELLLPDSTGA